MQFIKLVAPFFLFTSRRFSSTNYMMMELVTVDVAEGTLRGVKTLSRLGGICYSFKGVPYAKPPVGVLRFKMAEPPVPWSGVRDALADGSCCTQFNITTNKFEGNEDCLYLNVNSPQLPLKESEKPLKPVMVWIHGGGFTTGSNNSAKFGPDYLVNEDVVVVTINYRLGVLGFLCVEGPAASGNIGLKDQVVALQWIQQNISFFGGDPNNVTIFGESAGGSSVHFHMLSPMSKGLFHKAIAQSGVAFNSWGWEKHPREIAFSLGKSLGHESQDPEQLVEFLRTIDHVELVAAAKKCPLPDRFKHKLLIFPFVPSLEVEVEGMEKFLPDDPLDLVQQGKYHSVPYLTGFNSKEGLIMLKLIDFNNQKSLERFDNNLSKSIQLDLRFPVNFNKIDQVASKIRNFYLKGKPLSLETLSGFVDMQSDIQFIEAINWTVKQMAQFSKAPLYYYLFSHDGTLNYCKIAANLNYPGACHADDVGYLFRMDRFDHDLEPDSPDAITRSCMVKMWTNFAKLGDPTPGGDTQLQVTWLPHTVTDPYFLEIGEELKLGQNVLQERMKFWEDLNKVM